MTNELLQERLTEISKELNRLTAREGPWTPQQRSRVSELRFELESIQAETRTRDGGKTEKRDAALGYFLRHGASDIGQERGKLIEEMRDMGTGGSGAGIATSGGGIFVPIGFADKVTSAMKNYGPMLDVADVRNTATGGLMAWPEDDDSSVTGFQIGEGQQASSQDIAGLSGPVLNAWEYSSGMVVCSIALAQDAQFDFENYLAARLGIRLARILNTKFTIGVGTTEPYGLMTQATLGATAVGAGSNDGVSGANSIGTDDLVSLELSVDPAYRLNGAYMMHQNTYASIKKIKDRNGHPVFKADGTLNGYRVLLNPNFDTLQALPGSPPVTRKPVAFGDFSAYKVRRAPPILLRLTERFADFGKVAFMMYWRMDGALIDGGGGAVKFLETIF